MAQSNAGRLRILLGTDQDSGRTMTAPPGSASTRNSLPWGKDMPSSPDLRQLLDLYGAAFNDLYTKRVTVQQGHARERVAFDYQTLHRSWPSMPIHQNFVDFEDRSTTIGEGSRSGAQKRRRERVHDRAWQREKAGEAGVHNGRDRLALSGVVPDF